MPESGAFRETAEGIAAEFARGAGAIVAERNGEMLGCVLVEETEGDLYFGRLSVRPSARGQGVALEASRAVVSHAYEVLGWDEVQTYLNDANAPARALVVRLNGTFIRRQAFPDGLERDVYRIPPPTGA